MRCLESFLKKIDFEAGKVDCMWCDILLFLSNSIGFDIWIRIVKEFADRVSFLKKGNKQIGLWMITLCNTYL
jgi:hypothetical protein